MSDNKSNKNNSGLYVAVFFVLVILIVIMFFVKKDNIVSNLKKTNFFERVGVNTPEFVENHPVVEEKEVVQDEIEIDLMGNTPQTEVENKVSDSTPQKVSEKPVEISKTEEKKPVENKPAAPQKEVSATRTATLYFVVIGSDGSVNRKLVKRQLPKSDSPLTDAIKALISGPVPGEGECMNLIPAGTRLIGASVKDGVATLNFNENFEFNSYGVEGSIAQLMQIVYTATEFSTVKSVQFLIEGEKKEYLGLEGQWIGTPLSRGSF